MQLYATSNRLGKTVKCFFSSPTFDETFKFRASFGDLKLFGGLEERN